LGMTRRQALRATFAGLAGLANRGDGEGAMQEAKSGAIDAHVHVWTDDRARYPRPAGEADYPPPRFTPEDFLAHARPNGVARAVLVQMSFYRADHSYMLEAMRVHPGRFSTIGLVNTGVGDAVAAMTELAGRGVRGFRIAQGTASPQTWLDGAGMAAIWRFATERRLALCPLVNPDALAAIDRMCGRFPETTVVIDHLARIGVDGTIRDADVQALCALAKHRHVHVKVSAFYALGHKRAPYTDLAPMIRRVFEAYGPKRLMWGSDCPFQVQDGRTYRASVELVREHLDFLTAEDRGWLLSKTAESLFFRE
jgi:predicted TIM-barrel fold metal-dependent hydrolase